MLPRIFRALALPLLLGACAESVWAPDAQIEAVRFRDDGPPTLTLYTMRSTRDGNGAHSGLLISGSQRVIFDPSGSFTHPTVAERNDVIFGVNDQLLEVYEDAHARETFDLYAQSIEVSPEVAELALRLAMENGAVGNGRCSIAVTGLLSKLPGFESLRPVWFPNRAARQFGRLPGVETTIRSEADGDDKQARIAELLGQPKTSGQR